MTAVITSFVKLNKKPRINDLMRGFFMHRA